MIPNKSPDAKVRRLFCSANGWKSESDLWFRAIVLTVFVLLFVAIVDDVDLREAVWSVVHRVTHTDVNALPQVFTETR